MFRRERQRDFVVEFAARLSEVDGSSDLFRVFKEHDGRPILKWAHFLDLYDRHFRAFENPKFLEIGVLWGGSLELWRRYFGKGATIFGIDLNPECAGRVDAPNRVRIGSQNDPAFLRQVVEEMGGLDIVLDDGSHIGEHQRTSFRTLFPLLREGGVYAIEDLHTSYWKNWSGGYRRRGTGIEFVKELIDDLHQWWHDKDVSEESIGGIHFYDSIVFIEKAKKTRPQVVEVPDPAK